MDIARITSLPLPVADAGQANIPRSWNRMSASLLLADSPLQWRGKVDLVSLEHGIEGWALDLAKPAAPLRLQLLAGDELIAEVSTGLERADVVALLGSSAAPGFRFGADVLLLLDAKRASLPLRVALAEEAVEILADTVLPSVAQLLAAESAATVGFDLMERLGVLRQASISLTAMPLRPGAWQEIGCIEVMSIDECGLVWVQGWMRRSPAIDAAAAVVDGRKEPAGFVYTWFERDDLDSERCGFVGIVHSSWAPTASTTPLIFLKGEEIAYLRCISPTRIIKHGDFASSLRRLAQRCHTGPTAALLQCIDSPGGWTPTESGASAALDSAYVIPGFGCTATGWVLNPLSRPVRFALRFGASILSADEDSIVFSSRHDLESVAPGCHALLERAGFVAAFRGEISLRDVDAPILKIAYEDGTTSRHVLQQRSFRTVGAAIEPEALLTHYPSLTREPFFADLAQSLRQTDRAQAAFWRPMAISACDRAIVCVLANRRSSAYLLTEQLRAQLDGRKSPGVILIADQTAIRSDAVALRASLVNDAGIACSLVCARRPAQALYALDAILKVVGCERFVFLGPGVYLSDRGWESAFEYLDSVEAGGCFLGLSDPAAEDTRSVESAAAIGWNRAKLSAWLGNAAAILDGYSLDNGLSTLSFRHVPHGAWFTRELDGSAFVQAVNRVAR